MIEIFSIITLLKALGMQFIRKHYYCFVILFCFVNAFNVQNIDTSSSNPILESSSSLNNNNQHRLDNHDSNLKTSQQVNELRASEALESVRNWAIRFGRDIYYGTREATCLRSLKDQFDPAKIDRARRGDHKASIRSIDWTRSHADIVKTINTLMGWHQEAVENIARVSESLAGNHTFVEKLRFDYIDVHRLEDISEIEDNGLIEDGGLFNSSADLTLGLENNASSDDNSSGAQTSAYLNSDGQLISGETIAEPLGTPAPLQSSSETQSEPSSPDHLALSTTTTTIIVNQSSELQSEVEWQTPIKYLKLSNHPNFGDVPINTEESAVHVPVHIFPGDPLVMNGIAASQELTKTFRDNFVANPKLTNQYYASQTGFMRLFPAQKWQIPRTDPDLYDARIRPWYVAAASSRKDVIILIDSSGSMTGSRRDIAKGVVFEILDTLTDNDHFLILKFNDVVQQLGVPTCSGMRFKREQAPKVPRKNILFQQELDDPRADRVLNGTDVESLYLLPATGRNVRYIKSNFTIPTSGIANFSNALVTAFEVLRKYQDNRELGSQCNQAIMLITDGSPSDFSEIFDRYNYPNAPVRVFTYLIGREAGDGTHTKMMACHNRGFYTHVINLAEVRETIQQYIPVMARPLVLNRTHPITWTPAYAELTYQVLTDWIWESRRRERARAILASTNRGTNMVGGQSNSYVPNIRVTDSDSDVVGSPPEGMDGNGVSGSLDDVTGEAALMNELEALDLFGYHANPDCFWETRRNDLLTTVVQPVYDTKNKTLVVEKYLDKNIWFKKETWMRTANLLGVAAADMKINDLMALAPSHKLGPNGYPIMLTNNGLIMHHPDLRSILEPFSSDPSEKTSRILKPFFSSLDLTQVEHILNDNSDEHFLALRKEAVIGLTGWRELMTKRTMDCQRRVQTRQQIFYYKPLQHFPFSMMIAIPQPYGSYRVEAQVEMKSSTLPEKLTTYFTTSDFDLWTVHPDYSYCDGPSNNTITTLLDTFQRIEEGKSDEIQWKPPESSKPPIFLPGKIICDKDLVQSLVYDAVATFGFAETCGPPSPSAESSLLGMYGIRFSFVSTRSGLTRVRHYDAEDLIIRKEALAFAKKHDRAVDETFYSRTVDYNMLVNDSAILVQVPFNTHQKIRDRLNRHESVEEMINEDDGGQFEPPNSPDFEDKFPTTTTPPVATTRLRVKDMNLFEKLEILSNSSLHVIVTQSIVVNEGAQKAVAGVTGAFYDYSAFVMRLLNTTNYSFHDSEPIKKPAACYKESLQTDELCDSLKGIKCGLSNDTIDCLLVDNNGYIVVSEDLDFIGRHLKAYEPTIMSRLVNAGVFNEINITDYQSICVKQEERQAPTSASCAITRQLLPGMRPNQLVSSFGTIIGNFVLAVSHSMAFMGSLLVTLLSPESTLAAQAPVIKQQSMLTLMPNKTYLRPCERILTRYETKSGLYSSEVPEYFETQCSCRAWFVYEQVPKTNLLMLVVDTTQACRTGCNQAKLSETESIDDSLNTQYNIIGTNEDKVCSMLERESKLHRKKIDSCFAHHPDEEQIKLCGSASISTPLSNLLLFIMIVISFQSV